MPYRDPASAVLANPQVPENKRYCSGCDQPVGRDRDGQPGLTEGFCRNCGTRIELVDVTALPPGGCRFSGCRSDLTRAQPGPGSNVQRPVHVGVVRPAAGADHGVLPWALASVPAGVAGDTRPGWVHEHYPPAGAFSLASEDACELRPARVEDRPVEPGLGCGPVREERSRLSGIGFRFGSAGHPCSVQVLDRDDVALGNKCPRGLVVEIATAVADLPPFLGQGAFEALAVPRAGPGRVPCGAASPLSSPPMR